MQIVSLDGKMEEYFLKGEFVEVKVNGRKVKLKLALSDPEDDSFKTDFEMKFNLDKIDSFRKFCSLVKDFFPERSLEFKAEDFLGRKCDVCLAEVYCSDRSKRRIAYINPLKSDYKGITQHKNSESSKCISEISESDYLRTLIRFYATNFPERSF